MLTLQHASQLFHHLRPRNSRSLRQSVLERDLGHEDHLLDHGLDEQLPEEQTASCICGTRTTRTCTVGKWCSKSLEACRGTPASGPAASTRGCGRIPPTSSQLNKSKDAGLEGRVFRTLTTYFTCSLPHRSWPSSVPVGRCGGEAQPRPLRQRLCLSRRSLRCFAGPQLLSTSMSQQRKGTKVVRSTNCATIDLRSGAKRVRLIISKCSKD